MSDLLLQLLPPDLRSHLPPDQAEGAASFIEALEFHLRLQENLGCPASPIESMTHEAQLQSLIDTFAAAPNITAVLKTWQQVPQALEAAFIVEAETSIARDEREGATERAAGLRERLDELQHILAEQRALLTLPDDLLAQLQQALADGSSLAQALEAHPDLLHDFEQFVVEHQDQVAYVILRPLVTDCINALDLAGIWNAWQRTPEELHDGFLALLNHWISTLEQNGQTERRELFQNRLDRLNELRAAQQRLLEQIGQWLTQMTEPLSYQMLIDLRTAIPKELREIIPALAEAYAGEMEQAGNTTAALCLRGQSSMLRTMGAAVHFASQTALIQTLVSFLSAESDDEARAILATHGEVLLTAHTLESVRELIEESPSPHRERFQARAQILEERYRSSRDKINLRQAMLRLIMYYEPRLQSADEQQRYHTIKQELPQLSHLIEWALEHEFPHALQLMRSFTSLVGTPSEGSEASVVDWREYLRWCERALVFADRSGTQFDRAAVQFLRGYAWLNVARLPHEDRRFCLNQALAAYDLVNDVWQASVETGPLFFEGAISRASVIRELASLPGEDWSARLYEILALYDEALRMWSPDPGWRDVALLQHNRADLLLVISRLPGEDARTRLYEALAACEHALRFHALGATPVSRADTLLSQTAALLDLATMAGEDRRAHTLAALAACDEALRVYLPDQHRSRYALAQSRRGRALLELSRLPGEDRIARLYGAMRAYEEALSFFTLEQAHLFYADTLLDQANVFGDLASIYSLQEALRLNGVKEEPPQVQMLLGRANPYSDLDVLVGGDRRTWLGRALRSAWTALPIFREAEHQIGIHDTLSLLRGLRLLCGDDFAALWQEIDAQPAPDWGDDYTIDQLLTILAAQADLVAIMTFWDQVPTWQREPLLMAAEEHSAQAQREGDDLLAHGLHQKLDAIHRLGGCPPQLVRQSRLAVNHYLTLREAAYRSDQDVGSWQQVIAAGENLLTLAFDQNPSLDRRAVCKHLADDYICLALAYKTNRDMEAMLEALCHAVARMPDDAEVRAYYSRGLIRLGRLKEAAHELRVAQRFDPNLPGLAELEAMLTQALRGERQA